MILATAEAAAVVRGITGPDRAMNYRLAVGTGFRAGELRSLKPESFDLTADPPTVTLSAAYSKRRREDVQPIRSDLAELLHPWIAGKPRGELVLPLPDKTAKMMRVDLRRAWVAWIREVRGKADGDYGTGQIFCGQSITRPGLRLSRPAAHVYQSPGQQRSIGESRARTGPSFNAYTDDRSLRSHPAARPDASPR